MDRGRGISKASLTDVLISNCHWNWAKYLWNGLQSLTANWKLSWSLMRRYVIMSKTRGYNASVIKVPKIAGFWLSDKVVGEPYETCPGSKCQTESTQLTFQPIIPMSDLLLTITTPDNPHRLLLDTWPWESGMVGWKALMALNGANSPYPSSNNLISAII